MEEFPCDVKELGAEDMELQAHTLTGSEVPCKARVFPPVLGGVGHNSLLLFKTRPVFLSPACQSKSGAPALCSTCAGESSGKGVCTG